MKNQRKKHFKEQRELTKKKELSVKQLWEREEQEKREQENEKPQIDYEVKEVLGIEIEREDRSVGIFGNLFMIGFETEKKKVWLNVFDDEFLSLMLLMKPYVNQYDEQDICYKVNKTSKNKYERLNAIVNILKFDSSLSLPKIQKRLMLEYEIKASVSTLCEDLKEIKKDFRFSIEKRQK